MTTFTVPIQEYGIRLSRGHLAQWREGDVGFSVRNAAEILCVGTHSRARWHIFLFFGAEGQGAVPDNFSTTSDRGLWQAFVFLPREQYVWCETFLRTSDDAVFVWPVDDPESAHLTTRGANLPEIRGGGDTGKLNPPSLITPPGRPDVKGDATPG